jgi:15-cis-phytoene synthase
LYERAEHGIVELPMDCRPAIQAARLVYAEIGHQLAREGLDSVSRRTVVSKRRKLTLIAVSAGAAFMPPHHALGDPTPLAAIQFLVNAVAQDRAEVALAPLRSAVPKRSFDERAEWATDLYARLSGH